MSIYPRGKTHWEANALMTRINIFLSVLTAAILFAEPSSATEVAKYKVADGAIKESLTGKAGDPEKGKKAFLNRKQGNCLACHQVTALSDHPFHGGIGPSLDGVADRYDLGELRLQIVDAKQVNPDTIMPAFYRTDGFHRVLKKFDGKSVLTAEQVEDILAYLQTFK